MSYIAISISEGKQIDCQRLCQDIQNLIIKSSQETNGPFEKVLFIELRNIINSTQDNPIPKIEYKN